MGDSSMGALVPTVKRPEPAGSSSGAVTAPPPPLPPLPPEQEPDNRAELAAAVEAAETGVSDVDKDLLCPICMQIIKDAFLTACGHSFCYMCIVTHLNNKNDCPCCGHFLTTNHLFPNFLLNKVGHDLSTIFVLICRSSKL